jgi:hypothetical protein
MASTTAAGLVGVAAVVVVLGFATDRIDFRSGISMYFHAKNLTNARFRVYEGSPNRPCSANIVARHTRPECSGNVFKYRQKKTFDVRFSPEGTR